MSRPLLLLTRPQEEIGRTAEAAGAAGFETLAAPLLEIAPLPFSVPDIAFDALLFTSARAPAIVAAAMPGLRGLKAHAVGARTGEEAEACGFHRGQVGEGDGTEILRLAALAGDRRILHLAGEATATIAVPEGIELVRVPVYAAERVRTLPADALCALREQRVLATLLFSARTARHFRRLADEAGLAVERLRVAALSPAVAEAAGAGWAAMAVAGRPDLPALLSAARALWQGVQDGRASDRQPL